MTHDGAHPEALVSLASPVSWLSPQRPVEGGTVFVKPAVEDVSAAITVDQQIAPLH
jgi:hypothetical protein